MSAGDDFDLSGLGLLAGAANVIMQLGWAPVGHGVVESTVTSGQLFRHPVKRTRTTLTYLAVAVLGDDEDRRRYRNAVNRSHAEVRSGPDSPVAYNAFDPDLQLWVAACLYYGLEDIYLRGHRPPSPEEADARCRRGAVLGTTLQVPPARWPTERSAFERYWSEGLRQVRIDPGVRDYLDDVATMRFLPAPLPQVLGPLNRWVTTGFLPPALRRAMGYHWSECDQRAFDASMGILFSVERRLPTVLRRFPFNAMLWDVRRRARSGAALV
jgi:uncharacterized protein (DUF2236 family)